MALRLLKAAALLVPPLRRLYNQRASLTIERDRLATNLSSLQADYTRLSFELTRLTRLTSLGDRSSREGMPALTAQQVASNLIYDIGAHRGEDTDFYLGKGFDVIAVEANPELVQHLTDRFRDTIGSGRLTIVGKAVVADPVEEISFFINATTDDWSATDKLVASKGAMDVQEVRVPTVRLAELFAEFGVPHYMKVDIEGDDIQVARALLSAAILPPFVSFEFHEARVAAVLEAAGYRRYQMTNQALNGRRVEVNPPREGQAYWPGPLTGYHSGHFGRELPEEGWVDFEQLMKFRVAYVEVSQTADLADSWFDVHARLDPS